MPEANSIIPDAPPGREPDSPTAPAYLPANAVATDSEWDHHLRATSHGPWLSTTFATHRGVEFYVRDDLPYDTRARLKAESLRLGVNLYPVRRSDDDPLLW